jgi:hypothetical protein
LRFFAGSAFPALLSGNQIASRKRMTPNAMGFHGMAVESTVLSVGEQT